MRHKTFKIKQKRILAGIMALLMVANLMPVTPVITAKSTSDVVEVSVKGASYDGGSGTQQNPYQISSASQFASMATSSSSSYFILTKNIVLASTSYSGYTFYGNLDGRGHSVTGIYVNTSGGDVGLFGSLGSSACLSNLYLSGSINVSGGTGGTHAGMVAATSTSGSRIINVIVSGTITASQSLDSGYVVCGGFIGEGATTIQSCASNVSVSSTSTGLAGSYASGFVGMGKGGTISNCYRIGGSQNAAHDSTSAGYGTSYYGQGSYSSSANSTGGYSSYITAAKNYAINYSTSTLPLVMWGSPMGTSLAYSVTYNGNGGTGTVTDSLQYGYKANATIKSNSFTKTGHTFQGWGTSQTGNVTHTAGGTVTITDNLALYAIWKVNTYDAVFTGTNVTADTGFGTDVVTYNQEWSGTIVPKTGYEYPSTITIQSGSTPLTTAQYEYDSATGKITVPAEYVTGKITITATSVGSPYKIVFHGNGGLISGEPEKTKDVIYASNLAAPEATIDTEGWQFLGWSRSVDATTSSYAQGSDVSKLTTVKGAVLNLYAVWKYKDGTYPTSLQNGSFEVPAKGSWTNQFDVNSSNHAVKWYTTASDNKIEIGRPSKNLKASLNNYNVLAASDGEQFAELNATQVSALYQVIATVPGSTISWGLDHKARVNATETMEVWIGEPDHVSEAIAAYKKDGNKIGTATTAVFNKYSDLSRKEITSKKDKWYSYTGSYLVPAGQSLTTFAFVSLMTPASNSIGNLLDNIYFSSTVPKKKTPVKIQGSDGGTTIVTAVDGSQTLVKEEDVYNKNLEYGDKVSIEPEAKEGYTFIGAYVDGEYIPEEEYVKDYEVGENIPSSMTMIYAKDRTVSLILDGGSLPGDLPVENTLAAEANTSYTVVAPTKAQYLFDGYKIIGSNVVIQGDSKVVYEIDGGKPYLRVYPNQTSTTPVYSTASEDGIVLIATWEVDLSGASSMELMTNNNVPNAEGKLTEESTLVDTLEVSAIGDSDTYSFGNVGISRDGYTFEGWTFEDVYVLQSGDEIQYTNVGGDVKIIFPASSLTAYRAKYEGASSEEKARMDDYYLNDEALTIVAPESMTFFASWDAIQAEKPEIDVDTPANLNLEFGYITTGNDISVTASANEDSDLSYQWYEVKLDANGNETEEVITLVGEMGNSYTIPTNSARGTYHYYCKVTATNRYNSTQASIESTHTEVKVKDTKAPTVKIRLEDSTFWDKLAASNISFNKFFATTQTITITGDDGTGSGVDLNNMYYYLDRSGTTTEKTLAEIQGFTWTKYSDSSKPTLADSSKYVIYAKVSDYAGNTTIINSQGLVIDKIAPVTTLDQDTYLGSKTFTVTEEYLASITIDGNPAVANEDGSYTLVRKEGSYVIEVTDKAGNVYTKTVTIDYLPIDVPKVEAALYNGEVLTGKVEDGDDYTVAINEGGTNVGSYDVVFQLKDMNNTKWSSDVIGDYVIDEAKGTVTVPFEITKANNEYVDTLTCNSFTYDGVTTAKALAMSKFGTVSYQYYQDALCTKKTTAEDGATLEGGAPVNAGTYYVTVMVEGTDNYYALDVTNIGFEIKKADQSEPNVSHTNETESGKKDGSLTGITANMQWTQTPNDATSWSNVSPQQAQAGKVSGLAEGIYYVRLAADRNHNVGPGKKIIIDTATKKIQGSKDTGKIIGTVAGDDNGEFSVSIKLGSTVVDTITGLHEGDTFSFGNLADGVYNLEATDGTYKVTIMVTVVNGSTEKLGVVTVTNKQTVVEVEKGAPNVAVDGLNQLFDTSIVTGNPLAQAVLVNGGNIEIRLTASKAKEKTAIQKLDTLAQKNGKTVGMLTDLTVNMIVTPLSGAKTTSIIQDTKKMILIAIPLSAKAKGKTGYQAYRIHNGKEQTLAALSKSEQKSKSKEGFYVEEQYLYVIARYFSTYALAYEDKDATEETKTNKKNQTVTTTNTSTTGTTSNGDTDTDVTDNRTSGDDTSDDKLSTDNTSDTASEDTKIADNEETKTSPSDMGNEGAGKEAKSTGESSTCYWHWFMLLLMVVYALVVMIGKEKSWRVIMLLSAADIILSIVLVILGHCGWDVPFAIITLLIAGGSVLLKHILSHNKVKDEEATKEE